MYRNTWRVLGYLAMVAFLALVVFSQFRLQ